MLFEGPTNKPLGASSILVEANGKHYLDESRLAQSQERTSLRSLIILLLLVWATLTLFQIARANGRLGVNQEKERCRRA